MDDDGYYNWDDYGDDEPVVMDPFVTNEKPSEDWEEGEWEQFWTNFDEEFYGIGETPDEFVDTSAWSTDAIIAALNQYGAGWEHVSGTQFRNPATGQTYDSNTGAITQPNGTKSATNTGATGQARAASGASGGTMSGGSSGGSSQSSQGSSIDKLLKTIGSLVNAVSKTSTALNPNNQTMTAQQRAAATDSQNLNAGKIALAGVAVVGALLLIRARRK